MELRLRADPGGLVGTPSQDSALRDIVFCLPPSLSLAVSLVSGEISTPLAPHWWRGVDGPEYQIAEARTSDLEKGRRAGPPNGKGRPSRSRFSHGRHRPQPRARSNDRLVSLKT